MPDAVDVGGARDVIANSVKRGGVVRTRQHSRRDASAKRGVQTRVGCTDRVDAGLREELMLIPKQGTLE